MNKTVINKYAHAKSLNELLEYNYEDFKRETLQLEKEKIFEIASKITAVNDVYFYIKTHNWIDECEASYLFEFENPLIVLAEKWEEYSDNRGKDFGVMLDKIGKYGIDDFISDSFDDETWEEYGEDDY